ncbi:MAG TPA: metallophosphoesterase [Gemmataceae bacterium]|nr:metallophosphoesterase [Gemmataceae bacterium]
MPDPDRLLQTLAHAAEAFRATPGRRGRIVALDGADEVLVAGDLHGHVGNFRKLLAAADLGRRPRRHLVLQEVIHTRAESAVRDTSHQLVDLLAALVCQHPGRVHFLIGNHELAQATDRPIFKDDVTHNDLFWEGVWASYGDRAAEVYAAYLGLFGAAALAVRTPNRVFISHSLPPAKWLETFDPAALEHDPTDAAALAAGGSVYALLWGRDTSAEHVAAFLAKVDADLLITGHIPCDKGFEVPNERQVILDCMGEPACYCLLPADRPLAHDELVRCVHTL